MIKPLVFGLVAFILLVAVGIPMLNGIAAGTASAGSYSESFAGTNGTPSTLTFYVLSVTTFLKSTANSHANTTAVIGANSTRTLLSSTPIRTAVQPTVQITHDDPGTDNILVRFNGALLGNLTPGTTLSVFNVSAAGLAASNTINYTYLISNNANISRVQLNYTFWNASTGYSLAGGKITPTLSGTYLTAYTYGFPIDITTAIIVGVIAVLFAVLALTIFTSTLL